MFRPKGSLARAVYDKIHKDQELEALDKAQWYGIDQTRLCHVSSVSSKYFPSTLDTQTRAFLDKSSETSDSVCWQIWLSLATSVLTWWMSPTSVNGLLGRGSMFVFSTDQFRRLIELEDGEVRGALLDIGAGDGETTGIMRPFFSHVYVTEMSGPMRWSLAKKGFTVLDPATWTEASTSFELITCLNVLDRCSEPLELLSQIRRKLAPGGLAIVSFVIPYKPYVEFGSPGNKPKEPLPIHASSFEAEVVNFVEKVLEPNGWDVVRWTRLPYLCEGDMHQAYYWLTDALFVIRPSGLAG